MIRRFTPPTAALLALVLLCTACGAKTTAPEPPSAENPPAVEEQQPDLPAQSEEIPSETVPEKIPDAPAFDFALLENVEFTFCSGAGGWQTVLYVHADGTFDGIYTDSEMGDFDAEAYPNGTRYVSRFSGRFAPPVLVNDYTWHMKVAELTYADPFGEELADGFRYIYTDAYGISGAEALDLYVPGAPLAELPEAYLMWVGYFDLTQTTDTTLPFWGLYDPVAGNGFASYQSPSAAEQIQDILEQTEIEAAQLETDLQNAQTQSDMNTLSDNLYTVWDNALNNIWHLLKAELEPSAMEQLTAEQLTWIADKEAAVAAAGALYEGGSIYPLAVNSEAADWTARRVRELAAYLQ